MASFKNRKPFPGPSGLTKVDWTGVRPIYKKPSDEFGTLTDAFDLQFDDVTLSHLDHLLACIDLVDQEMGDLFDDTDRTQLCDDIVELLRGRYEQVLNEHASRKIATGFEHYPADCC